ncbi:hypothetical protein MTO96_022159 [Rhipicephalus appendiculatus]
MHTAAAVAARNTRPAKRSVLSTRLCTDSGGPAVGGGGGQNERNRNTPRGETARSCQKYTQPWHSFSLRGRCAVVPAAPARNNRAGLPRIVHSFGGRQQVLQESAEFDSACLFEEHPPFKEAGRGAAGATGGRRSQDSDNYGKWAANDVESREANVDPEYIVYLGVS